MKSSSKIMLLAASLILIGLYFTPLWWIKLDAPQYPEGLGLYIWIDQITGQNPNDLKTINGLNHYIGMKIITPESIPELTLMPYIVGFLIVSGFLVTFLSDRNWLLVWIGIFLIVLVAGLVDFYLWEYDYGHNLNPDAPIKVPGMTYQPPLIGTKQLLNMRTTSLPYIGGALAGLSFLLAVIVWYREKRTTNISSKDAKNENVLVAH
ncbi:hypothetical protein K1X84_10235 [bacterium]|nr:hypothetical protein [bacterium]